uniref:Putative secreted protein n=1 Tax=Anopheles marajoara TaxID=58244 RepID=A0A2M4CE74_9DIPT
MGRTRPLVCVFSWGSLRCVGVDGGCDGCGLLVGSVGCLGVGVDVVGTSAVEAASHWSRQSSMDIRGQRISSG